MGVEFSFAVKKSYHQEVMPGVELLKYKL